MTYESDNNQIILNHRERWETGLMPVIPLNLSIHALNEIWSAKTELLESFNLLMRCDINSLNEAQMARIKRFPERIEIVSDLALQLSDIASPKVIDVFLNSI